jgi:sigma-E factor negative regulatory protein RseC
MNPLRILLVIEEQAKVIALDSGWVWVETQRKTMCGQCAANKGCGTSVLANVLGKKRNTMAVLNTIPVKVGDDVIIGIEEGSLVRGSLLIYALPLILLIVFGLLGEVIAVQMTLENNDSLTAIFAGIGLLLGFGWLKFIAGNIRKDAKYQPKLIKIVNSVTVCK